MGKFTNSLKTIILIALLTALMLWVGQLMGGTSGLIIALLIVIVMNSIMYWFSDKIVLSMYKAKEIGAGHRASRIVHDVARRAGMPVPKTFIVESATPNAFATGRDPQHAAVAVTTGILTLLDDRELKGVIAHEISHIKNRDTLIQTIAGVMAGVISYVASMAQWTVLFGRSDDDRGGGNMISLLVLIILAPLIATILQLALSRAREYLADESAAKTLHDGKGLSSALKKLEKGVNSHPFKEGEGNSATSGLFIVNPFRGSFIMELFSTHPPMAKRIAKLDSLGY